MTVTPPPVTPRPNKIRRSLAEAFGRLRLWHGALLGSVALLTLITCARSRPSTPSDHRALGHGIAVPLGTLPPEARAAAPGAALDGADHGRADVALALADFRPLLTTPELGEAAQALEDQRPEVALAAIERWLKQSPATGIDLARWQFLRGTLLDQVNQRVAAIEAFDAASANVWPLSGHALFHAARLLVREGQHSQALERLARLPHLAVLDEKAGLLTAEAAFARGDRARALVEWRAYLARPPSASGKLPDNWSEVALAFSDALLNTSGTPPGPEELQEGLTWADRVAEALPENEPARARAEKLRKQALAALPASERKPYESVGLEALAFALKQLVLARDFEHAEPLVPRVLRALPSAQRFSTQGCEIGVLQAKTWAGLRRYGQAADLLGDLARHCRTDSDQRAQILYLAGTYAVSDKRYALGIQYFQALEKDLPLHRLADDARLRAAQAYLELGSESRFSELLSTLPDVYPEGDMVLDGVFELAVRRIAKQDWPGATTILQRAARWALKRDPVRGTEFSGRERYFLARALMETGETELGASELSKVVRELPLSYYMLHAFSRLEALDPARAALTLKTARDTAALEPFRFVRPPELQTEGFQRVIELLRVGEIAWAARELEALGYGSKDTAPQLLWAVALLYDKAGAAQLSHGVARGLLTDWLARWPSGDWVSAWQIAFPRPYEKLVHRFAKDGGIADSLAYAIMREESGFDPRAVSPAAAYGLMQLIEPTARDVAKPLGLPHSPLALQRPAVNIALGCRFLGKLTQGFEKNPELAIPGYNAGPGRPRRWLRERPNLDFDVWVELIPLRETRRYTKRVLASRAAYRVLYDGLPAEAALRLPIKLSL